MIWPHPSDRGLSRWAAGRPSLRSSDHAQHCPQCQERLEQITELEPQVRAQLEASLAPTESFEARLRDRLEQKVSNREALAVVADLMDAGLRTSQMLVEGEQKEEDDG